MKDNRLHIIARKMVAVTLFLLLALLAGINLFIYSSKKVEKALTTMAVNMDESSMPEETDSDQSAAPDEKSPDRGSSIAEEYLHDRQEASVFLENKLIHTLLLVEKKIPLVHFELITPPPDWAI